MKLYVDVAIHQGLGIKDMDNGHWTVYADVKCSECQKEYSWASVGGLGAKCPRCGGECK